MKKMLFIIVQLVAICPLFAHNNTKVTVEKRVVLKYL